MSDIPIEIINDFKKKCAYLEKFFVFFKATKVPDKPDYQLTFHCQLDKCKIKGKT